MSDNKTLGEAITDALKRKALSLFDEKPPEEKKPSNIGLVLAWIGFNFVYLILDTGTSFMVSALTSFYYGIMTFVAGIGPFVIYEALFMRAYNTETQRRISIGGAGISIISTVFLALIVGIINAITYFQITALPEWVPVALEVTLIVGLVVAASIHGLLWIVYYFSDQGIVRKQKHVDSIAKRQQKTDDFAMAQDDVKGMVELAKILDEYEKNNQVELLAKAYEQLTGQRLNIQSPKQGQQNTPSAPKMQPVNVNAATVQQPKPSNNGNNPTNPT